MAQKAMCMKIATFNVNGINGRLPVLLRWLAEAKPGLPMWIVMCVAGKSRAMTRRFGLRSAKEMAQNGVGGQPEKRRLSRPARGPHGVENRPSRNSNLRQQTLHERTR